MRHAHVRDEDVRAGVSPQVTTTTTRLMLMVGCRRMEDAAAAASAQQDAGSASPATSAKSPTNSAQSRSPKSPRKAVQLQQPAAAEEEERFTGLSCLLITWKTNPEVENFQELYTDSRNKRRNNNLADQDNLVSEKSLSKNYKIIGKVSS